MIHLGELLQAGCDTMLWRPEPESNRMDSRCKGCSVPHGNSGLLSNRKKPDVARLPMVARGHTSGFSALHSKSFLSAVQPLVSGAMVVSAEKACQQRR